MTMATSRKHSVGMAQLQFHRCSSLLSWQGAGRCAEPRVLLSQVAGSQLRHYPNHSEPQSQSVLSNQWGKTKCRCFKSVERNHYSIVQKSIGNSSGWRAVRTGRPNTSLQWLPAFLNHLEQCELLPSSLVLLSYLMFPYLFWPFLGFEIHIWSVSVSYTSLFCTLWLCLQRWMLHALELKLEDGCELYHVGAGNRTWVLDKWQVLLLLFYLCSHVYFCVYVCVLCVCSVMADQV